MTKKNNVSLNRRKRRRRRSRVNWKAVAALAAILVAIVVLLCLIVTAITKKPAEKKVTKNTTEETSAVAVAEEETTTADPTVQIDIMMIGDMLMHEGVIKSGLASDGTYNYDHLFSEISSDIKAADIAIVNQETILGGPDFAYTGYPTFNSPFELGDAEVNAGFNVILHATNHTLDKGLKGTQNCINFWKTNHPETAVLGINDTEEEYNNIYVYEKEGFKVALLNYTYGTNGIPVPDAKPYIVNLLDKDKITQDVTKAKQIADMVVVLPHWGQEYVYQPNSDQKYWTNLFLSLGVDVVIGTHSHVLEPVEVVSDEQGHEMLVYYSLGNFTSNQNFNARMLGGLAKVSLIKDKTGCYVKDYSLTPVVTHKLFGYKLTTTYKIANYTEALASQNAIRNDGNLCYTSDAWGGCKCGAYELGYSSHGGGIFSLQYCHDMAKMILGDLYDQSAGMLYVSLHPNGKTSSTSTVSN